MGTLATVKVVVPTDRLNDHPCYQCIFSAFINTNVNFCLKCIIVEDLVYYFGLLSSYGDTLK